MRGFIRTLAWCSEKAAHLARACRREKDLFQLLVQEKKKDTEGGPGGFAQDFKTLADVLIQETVRYDLAKSYPDLADHILGEESNEFTNTLGEKIKVRVCNTQEETSNLLCKVLDGHKVAADLLAKEVHAGFSDVGMTDILGGELDDVSDDVDSQQEYLKDLGIWIDPIDGTNQYIRGKEVQPSEDLTHRVGLGVVTVLIGVFNRKTGAPVIGVVNQPFVHYDQTSNSWSGKIHWGFAAAGPDGQKWRHFSSGPVNKKERRQMAVISTRESSDIVSAVKASGFEVITAAGAGYKILLVILGYVDIYITTRTYKWDTCAGDAILNSLGGGIKDLKTGKDVVYNQPGEGPEPWANFGLIVAYRNESILTSLQPLVDEAKKTSD